jgi:nitric oxide reductase large subunit
MQQGSVWGHGSYLAPDWSADWLHREAVALVDRISQDTAPIEGIPAESMSTLFDKARGMNLEPTPTTQQISQLL